jgi:hypothetical protein
VSLYHQLQDLVKAPKLNLTGFKMFISGTPWVLFHAITKVDGDMKDGNSIGCEDVDKSRFLSWY